MKQTVNLTDFRDAFRDMNRENNFSYEGLEALYDWFEEMDAATGEESELDVIAICCEFTEYENLEELQQNYTDIQSMDDLENSTTVIRVDDERFIIIDF